MLTELFKSRERSFWVLNLVGWGGYTIAAYLGDKELAKEVVFGLSNNDIVEGVLIINNESVLYSDGNMDASSGQFSQRFTLMSPFIENEKVGEMWNINHL